MAINLTLKKPAKASSSMAGFGPQGAVDGSGLNMVNQSRWVSGGQDPGEWLEVDLLYYCSISSFTILNGNNTGADIQNLVRNVDVQIQQDGDWHSVAQIRDNTKPQIDVIMNNPVITSKVRLFFPIGEAQFRIFEFMAYGEQSNYKRADRYPQKNKFSVKKFDAEKYVGGGTLWEYDLYLKPNTKYTFSTNAPYIEKGYANVYADGVSTGSAGVKDGQPRTVTTNSEGKTRLFVRNENTTDPSDATQKILSGEYWIQIEEGETATPYEAYRLDHKPAVLYPLDNLIKPFTSGAWSLLDETITKVLGDYKMQTSAVSGINAINVPVKNATQYTFSVLNPGSAIYFIDSYDANGANLSRHTDPAGNRNELLTFTTHSKASYVRIILRNSGSTGKMDTWENPKLQLGSMKTPFAPYKEGNKPAKLYPGRNQLTFDQTKWTLRNGTTYAKFEGDRITYDGNADYAGVQIMLDDKKFVGRTVTFGGDHHPDANVLFFYKKADGSGAYIGLASYESYRTITIPGDASECRFYTQNNPGTRGEFWCENIFVNIGTDPVFEPYKEQNKPAKKYLKNFIKPLDTWAVGTAPVTTVNFLERTPDRVTVELNSNSQYGALLMPIDMNELKPLLGQTVTLSAKAIERFGYNTTVALRFYGGASGNLDMVLSSNLTTTKTLPTDATQAFIKIQNAGTGYAKIMVDQLQLEIGSDRSEYSRYGFKSKPLLK
jgi:hypothetical protein